MARTNEIINQKIIMYKNIIKTIIRTSVALTLVLNSISYALSPPVTSGDMGNEEVKVDMYKTATDQLLAGGGRKHIDKEWIRQQKFNWKNLFTIEGLSVLRDLGIKNAIEWQKNVFWEVIERTPASRIFSKLDNKLTVFGKSILREGLRQLNLTKITEKDNSEIEKFVLRKLNKTPEEITINGVKVEFKPADYKQMPKQWENNKIYEKENIIDALEYYRENEAHIPKELLDIREVWFPVESGKLSIGGIWKARLSDEEKKDLKRKYGIKDQEYKYVLGVHTIFKQMWEDIRQHDIWFPYSFLDENGEPVERVASAAWSLFYRFAKHEMGDLKTPKNSIFNLLPLMKAKYEPKGDAHLTMHRDLSGLQPPLVDEIYSNLIGGRYNIVNDAVWLWFLHSYCYDNVTRYSNLLFDKRLKDVFTSKEAIAEQLPLEFPNLWKQEKKLKNTKTFWTDRVEKAIKIATALNFHYFIKRKVEVKEIDLVSNKLANEYFLMEKESRKLKWKTLFATGIEEKEPQFSWIDLFSLVFRFFRETPPDVIVRLNRHLKQQIALYAIDDSWIVRRAAKKIISTLVGKKKDLASSSKEKWVIYSQKLRIYDEYLSGIADIAAELYLKKQLKEEVLADFPLIFLNRVFKKVKVIEEKKKTEEFATDIVLANIGGVLSENGIRENELTADETHGILQSTNLLNKNQIEVLMPESWTTQKMRDRILKKHNIDGKISIKYIAYEDSEVAFEEALKTKLRIGSSDIKRIIIIDDKRSSQMIEMVKKAPYRFINERVVAVNMPRNNQGLERIEKAFYEKQILMMAVMIRLFEKGENRNMEMVLKSMLKEYYSENDPDIEDFLNKLDDSKMSASKKGTDDIIERITFFVKNAIKPYSYTKEINDKYKLVDVFWTYA